MLKNYYSIFFNRKVWRSRNSTGHSGGRVFYTARCGPPTQLGACISRSSYNKSAVTKVLMWHYIFTYWNMCIRAALYLPELSTARTWSLLQATYTYKNFFSLILTKCNILTFKNISFLNCIYFLVCNKCHKVKMVLYAAKNTGKVSYIIYVQIYFRPQQPLADKYVLNNGSTHL